ncbi:MAG: hypothetical protein AB1679_08385 [Actinomycetota bacterium]
MIIFLPLILLFLVFGVLSGQTNIVFLLPTLLLLGAGAVFVTIALRDGRPKRDPSVRSLPTDHLRRQLHLALRPHRNSERRSRTTRSR